MRPTASCGQSCNFFGAYDMLPNSILKTLGPSLVAECCWVSFFFHLPIPVSQSHSAPGQPNEHCQLAPRWKPPPIRPSAKCGRATTRQRPRRRPHQDLSSWAKHMRTKLVGDGRGNVMPNAQKNCSEACPVIMLYLFWTDRSGQPAQQCRRCDRVTFCDRAPCSLELELLNLIIQHHPTAHQVVCKRGHRFYPKPSWCQRPYTRFQKPSLREASWNDPPKIRIVFQFPYAPNQS